MRAILGAMDLFSSRPRDDWKCRRVKGLDNRNIGRSAPAICPCSEQLFSHIMPVLRAQVAVVTVFSRALIRENTGLYDPNISENLAARCKEGGIYVRQAVQVLAARDDCGCLSVHDALSLGWVRIRRRLDCFVGRVFR